MTTGICSSHSRRTKQLCDCKHGYPLGHPRYPGRPRFHNRISGVGAVNIVATNGEIDKKEDDTLGSGLNITIAQYLRLVALLWQTSHVNLSYVGPFFSDGLNLGNKCVLNDFTVFSTILSSQSLSTSPCIIDSGAIDHITHSLDHFQIKPIHIKLPNGNFFTSHYLGTVQFSPTFAMHDILYVPQFNFNLISISKLIFNIPYTLTFSNDSCKIQKSSLWIWLIRLNCKVFIISLLARIGKSHHLDSHAWKTPPSLLSPIPTFAILDKDICLESIWMFYIKSFPLFQTLSMKDVMWCLPLGQIKKVVLFIWYQ